MMKTGALAKTTYVDPSALLKLYIHERESAAMNAWRRRARGPLAVTHHGRVEVTNAICLAGFRGDITAEAMNDSMASFDELAQWSDDRIWEELLTRLRSDDGQSVRLSPPARRTWECHEFTGGDDHSG